MSTESPVQPAPVESLPQGMRRRTSCRGCGGTVLHEIIALGPTPLANSLPATPTEAADEPSYPLDVWWCPECTLLQLRDVVDPEILFRNYVYVTGTSATMRDHFRGYAEAVCRRLDLGADDLAVEVASNDGSLLRHFVEAGIRALGVEPARNIAAIARAEGVPTVEEFFSAECAEALRQEHGPAAAVMGNNVLAHVDDPVAFLRGAAALLRPDGAVFIEVPYVKPFLDHREYDTVYHEHLSYFSVAALARIFERAGLTVQRVDHQPVHGGTIRVEGRLAAHAPEHAPEVRAMIAEERADGLGALERYQEFADGVRRNRTHLRTMLADLHEAGDRVVAYGAPAKGNTLLNYCDIGAEWVEFVVDRNPLKQGRYTPGTHLPIHPPEILDEAAPDYLLILAWNFADEIMSNFASYRAAGGRFIIPIPTPRVV